jgi:hypothetical protein
MTIAYSPSIATGALVFHYDMRSPKSYRGPPVSSQLVPNGIYAGYPTYPSGWGTYNTNQYGSGTYFSIGTVTGVASNIVTCPSHSLRTYDVVQPQTTGGGVTAGTNYLVRKWDANTFSLYSYDGTQDDYTIFDHQSNFNNDSRVSVSSGITNMWWGYPHLPNSGIMKQIIPNGFRNQGRVHDCLRVHWYRPDGVCDGMAYGNTPSVTAGNTYTVSWWHRAATPNAVGQSIVFERWTNGNADTGTFTLGKNWQQYAYTFTTTQTAATYFYWFNNSLPAHSAWDIAEIMCFQGTGTSSEYQVSSRSNTACILDTTGRNAITATSLTYTGSSTFSFNGSSNYMTAASSNDWAFQLDGTVEQWVYISGNSGTNNRFWCTNNNSSSLDAYLNGSSYNVYFHGGSVGTTSTIPTGQWVHLAVTYTGGNITVYFNGVAQGLTGTTSGYNITNTGTLYIGQYSGGGNYYFNGQIAAMRVYSRGLLANEIANNFNAHRHYYGV